MHVSIETLKRLIRYEPETGELVWLSASPDMFSAGVRHSAETRCAIWNSKYPGKPALAYRENNRPYAYGDIFGKKYYAHRVAFALMTGKWPKIVDHIDGDKTNNAWSNLREVSVSGNARNTVLRSDNASGCPGVYYDKKRDKWAAEIYGDRKIFLGRHETKSAAITARRNAENELGYTARHGSKRSR